MENQEVKKELLEALQEKHGDKPQAILQSNTMLGSHDTLHFGQNSYVVYTHIQVAPVVHIKRLVC